MKVIVAGSRGITDYQQVRSFINKSIETDNLTITEIVSGTAKGVDTLGELYAEEHHIPINRFVPDWDKYKKAAGFKRNAEMAEYADRAILVWDTKSKGTSHMIDLMS